MPPDTFGCPDCDAKLRRTSHLCVGALVRCPRCDHRFLVPPEEQRDRLDESPGAWPTPRDEPDRHAFDRDATRRAEDPLFPAAARPDGYDDFDLRRRRIPDDEDYPRSLRGRVEDLSNDYDVTVSRWLSLAWQHYGAFVGPCLGYLCVVQLINSAAQMISGLITLILDPALQAGTTVVALEQLKARPWTFGSFFGGFKVFGQALCLSLLQTLAVYGIMAPGVIGGFLTLFLDTDGHLGDQPATSVLSVVVACACFLGSALLGMYFGVRMAFFALPLIIDRGFGVIDAIRGSWRLTSGHVVGMLLYQLTLYAITFGPSLVIVGLLIPVIMGLSANGPGQFPVELIVTFTVLVAALPMLFTIPFIKLAQAAAYLDVAGTQPPTSRQEADRRRDDDY